MEIIDEFMNEFNILLKKYSIDDIVLVNFDDDKIGYRQLMKFLETGHGRLLVMSFSGKEEIMCPCCEERGRDEKESETEKQENSYLKDLLSKVNTTIGCDPPGSNFEVETWTSLPMLTRESTKSWMPIPDL